ncbi:MAG: FUSC family protein [Acetobacteraceae bacterium]|nr:FUSC family protein [Acetobacteraceae bacterium]
MDALEAARARVRRWLQGYPPPGARVVDELECMLSVLLAILIAHLIGARNISWAAFSGCMVMRGHIADSLLRGTLRVLGTAIGAGLALLIVPAVQLSWPMASLAGAAIGGVTLYGALTGRRSYAWLFVGLTFEMILLDKIEHPNHAIAAFASTRLLEVTSGTGACIIVSTLSALTARRRWPGSRAPAPQRIGWHRHALRHAAQGVVALAFLPLLGSVFAVRELAQSAISIMAVMLVPVSSLGASGLVPVSRKLVQRTAGCLAGAALASPVLFAAQGRAAVLIAGTAIGVLLGRHIENGGHSLAYVGTQFTLAILITLVPDSFADAAISPALDRLSGILLGMALLEPVLVAWHLVAPERGSRSSPQVASNGTTGE